MKKEFKAIAMKCTEEQFNTIKPILSTNGHEPIAITRFHDESYLVNNLDGNKMRISNIGRSEVYSYDRTIYNEWNQDKFLEYCGIKKQIEKNIGYKLSVPAIDVLEIHKVACLEWKKIFKDYLGRVDAEQNITFTETEVDNMFEAATKDQKKVLTKIFGKKKNPVDFDKLKTGSKVMIRYTGEHCTGISEIDLSKPVDIVFYKTKHCILASNRFDNNGTYNSYITFHQNGKFVLFASNTNTDYIVDVIEY